MDRLTRKELKTDNFALEVEHGVEYVAEHKQQVMKYAIAAVAVLVLGLGIYFFRQYQVGNREDALRAALKIQEANVGAEGREAILSFPSQAAKDEALKKSLGEVADKYSGTDQGEVARYFLGTAAADKGDLDTAEKAFKHVIDNGSDNYAALSKLALATLYKAQGKTAEGEKLLRSLIDKPTLFVSKEDAMITLGRYIASTNPAEARKLLEPLRTERGPVSRAALSALAEIPQK